MKLLYSDRNGCGRGLKIKPSKMPAVNLLLKPASLISVSLMLCLIAILVFVVVLILPMLVHPYLARLVLEIR